MMPADDDVHRLVDHLFRRQAGRLIAVLTRIFGPDHLDLAEDVTQEALIAALEVWPYHGIPKNPTAWLAEVAKNRALNRLKRKRVWAEKAKEVVAALDVAAQAPRADADGDDVVRLMFVACHPSLSAESRVALTLSTVAGFSVDQIAGALLAQPTAVAQRLVRAKGRIRELGLTFEVPAPAELPGRLDSLLEVLYLVFNEGYSARGGEHLLRRELCDEAIRLARLIAAGLADAQPKVHALLALMLLQAARLRSRADAGGELLLLEDQDRSLWDRALLAEGFRHLDASARGDVVTSYHLEAGIAACHAAAASYADTDWSHIVDLYDDLAAIHPSPVVALNRAIAVSRRDGADAGLAALDRVRDHPALTHYYLFWATLARLHADSRDFVSADACYRKALACPCSAPERRYLLRRAADVDPSRR